MDQDTLDFITKISQAASVGDAFNEASIHMESLGASAINYVFGPPEDLTFISTAQPGWIEYYMQEKYDQIDDRKPTLANKLPNAFSVNYPTSP